MVPTWSTRPGFPANTHQWPNTVEKHQSYFRVLLAYATLLYIFFHRSFQDLGLQAVVFLVDHSIDDAIPNCLNIAHVFSNNRLNKVQGEGMKQLASNAFFMKCMRAHLGTDELGILRISEVQFLANVRKRNSVPCHI